FLPFCGQSLHLLFKAVVLDHQLVDRQMTVARACGSNLFLAVGCAIFTLSPCRPDCQINLHVIIQSAFGVAVFGCEFGKLIACDRQLMVVSSNDASSAHSETAVRPQLPPISDEQAHESSHEKG